MKTNTIVKLKLDTIFKRVFGDPRKKHITAAFLADVFEIPKSRIKDILFENVELPVEYVNQKFSRLDVKLTVDDKIIDIEIQIWHDTDYAARSLFYWSKLYSDQLKAGQEYNELKKTICINILGYDLFACKEYASHFQVLESSRYELLTDKFGIYFFELQKVASAAKRKRIEDWLNVINAETEDELMAIQEKSQISEVREVAATVRELSADEKVRQEAFYREKQLRDQASALKAAEAIGMQKGMQKGRIIERCATIRNMLQRGKSVEEISDALGLSVPEINELLAMEVDDE